jgi:uncharacterized protein
MNTKIFGATAMAVVILNAGLAHAQLSSPIPNAKPGTKTAKPANASSAAANAPAATSAPAVTNAPAASIASVPAGQGPGVHSPNSPFAPLPDRADVVPWSMLTSIKTKTDNKKILPVFNMEQMALHQKTQKIQGFMMPLEPGEKQRHFLLTSVPMSCSFCLPGGPESMIEVRTKTPIKYTLEPLVMEGTFVVLNDDPYGLYYRITDAASVK